MSKNIVLNRMRYELDKLNERIDVAIIEGRSYKALATRHKILLARFNRLQTEKHSWLEKSFRFLTLF